MEVLQSKYFRGDCFLEFARRNIKHRDACYECSIKWVEKFQDGEALYIQEITEDWGIGFKRFLLINKAHNTASNYLCKVRALLSIAVRQNIIVFNPLQKIKIPLRRPESTQLKADEIATLYLKLKVYTKNKREVLRAFLLGLETGLRICDVLTLREENIKDGRIRLYAKKNGKFIESLLTDRALGLIEEGLPNIKISKEGIYWHIRRIFKENDIISKAKFHLARHTFANAHVELGTPIPVLQQLMGHNDIDSTMWYINPTQSAKDEAMKRFGGR